MIPCRHRSSRLPEQVLAEAADFGARIDDDAERWEVWDEQGRPVAAERLLGLIAERLLAHRPQATVVLANDISPQGADRIVSLGARVLRAEARRAEMACAMHRHQAAFGASGDGRFWYGPEGIPMPDALRSLTVLLGILSQSDRRLSEVLDHGLCTK